jgi:malonyl-CoA O-methyltransferase
MLARARAKASVRTADWVRHALPGALPFPDCAFDLAVLGLVLEHVDDIGRAFREIARVLRARGRCVVSGLHEERTAAGDTARFIDPATGERRPITTYHRSSAEYRAAAAESRLNLLAESTLTVTAELAERYPRATRYVGRPLGWVACWER